MGRIAGNIRIDERRLWDLLMEMAEIGATPKGGVRRLTLSPVDKAGRDREAAERARALEEARAKGEMATAGTPENAPPEAEAGGEGVADPDTPIPPLKVGESEK